MPPETRPRRGTVAPDGVVTMICEECGATWRRSARFCGRCGAVLSTRPLAADTSRRPTGPRLTRRMIAGVAAGCLVVLGGVAVAVGEPWEALQAGPSQDVEVPPSPEGTLPEDADRPRADWESPAPAVLCQPAPCERWRVHLPTGTTVVDGDTAYHVGSTNWRTEMTAIDVDTGAVRWRENLAVPDAVNGEAYGGPSPTFLTDQEDVIVLAVEGRVEARERANGEVVWTLERDGFVPFWLEGGPSDTIVVFAGVRRDGPDVEPGWSTEVVLSLEAATGALRWERAISMPLSFDPIPKGVIVAVADPSEQPPDDADGGPEGGAALVGLDASTGETLWTQPVPRHGFGTSGSVLHTYEADSQQLWDLRTGEPFDVAIPDVPNETVSVEMHGELVAVRSYAEDQEGQSPEHPLQHLAVYDPADGTEHFSDSAPGWVATAPLPDGGVVIGSGQGDVLRLTTLGPGSSTRWALEFEVPPRPEWPRWPLVLADGTIAVIATVSPDVPDLAAHRIDAATGEILERFHLDVDPSTVDPHVLQMRWPMVIDHGTNRSGTVLHGHAGSLQTTQHVDVLSIDPLVVRTPSGTLARLDEGIVLGSS